MPGLSGRIADLHPGSAKTNARDAAANGVLDDGPGARGPGHRRHRGQWCVKDRYLAVLVELWLL